MIPQLEMSEVQAQAATAHLNHMQAVAAAYGQQISDAQIAAQQQHQQRLQKPGHRPLGRTQSAPLPLGKINKINNSIATNLVIIYQVIQHYRDYQVQHQSISQPSMKTLKLNVKRMSNSSC